MKKALHRSRLEDKKGKAGMHMIMMIHTQHSVHTTKECLSRGKRERNYKEKRDDGHDVRERLFSVVCLNRFSQDKRRNNSYREERKPLDVSYLFGEFIWETISSPRETISSSHSRCWKKKKKKPLEGKKRMEKRRRRGGGGRNEWRAEEEEWQASSSCSLARRREGKSCSWGKSVCPGRLSLLSFSLKVLIMIVYQRQRAFDPCSCLTQGSNDRLQK